MYDAIAENPNARPNRNSPEATGFRPIHYLGSKLRFLPQILAEIDSIDPSHGTLLDLFSGSGTVSLAASEVRDVFSSDIQEYSRVLCSAILSSTEPVPHRSAAQSGFQHSELRRALSEACAPLLEIEGAALSAAAEGQLTAIRAVLEEGSLVAAHQGVWPTDRELRAALRIANDNMQAAGLMGPSSVCTRHFGGAFFSYRQAIELDVIADWSRTEAKSDVALAALLSTASDIVNTVGKQFAQPLRLTSKDGTVKTHLTRKIIADRSMSAIDKYVTFLERYAQARPNVPRNNKCLRGDYAEVLREFGSAASVIYADPPYTRDHYSRFYHVLETLALGDDPAIDQSNLGSGMSRGFYRAQRVQSDFCIKSKAPNAFKTLFSLSASADAPLVLSYSAFSDDRGGRPRLLSIEAITELASVYYSNVQVTSLEGEHSKLTTMALNKGAGTTTEVLLSCTGPRSR